MKHGTNHTFNYLVLLQKVERQEVDELPNKFKPDWNPNVCMAFLHHFLEQLKQKLSLLPEGSFLLIEPEPKSKEFKFSIMDESEMDAVKFFGTEFAVSIFMDKSSLGARFISRRANNKNLVELTINYNLTLRSLYKVKNYNIYLFIHNF